MKKATNLSLKDLELDAACIARKGAKCHSNLSGKKRDNGAFQSGGAMGAIASTAATISPLCEPGANGRAPWLAGWEACPEATHGKQRIISRRARFTDEVSTNWIIPSANLLVLENKNNE